MSESEVKARSKFACPACGAEAQWNAAKQALVCPFCGTESPMSAPPLPQDAGEGSGRPPEIVENDLEAALSKHGSSAERGWQAEKKSVKCQSCQAISVFNPERVSQRCDFCGSSALIPLDQQEAPIRPESLLEFKISETAVRDSARSWYKSRWWAPNKLKSRALTDTIHGAYLPYWTFDAQTYAQWEAESGYHYYVTEQYTDNEGRAQTRQVQRTRWEPSSGSLQHFFDDELVPASRGVQEDLLRKIEPFPTTEKLRPYEPAYLSGWVVEQYQIDLPAAAGAARRRMDEKLRQLCGAQVPGDTYRGLQVYADYSAQTFKHILVPVWVLGYTYGSRKFQLVVNGYTGQIAGTYPKSWVKITLAILAALLVLLVILLASGKGSTHASGRFEYHDDSSSRSYPNADEGGDVERRPHHRRSSGFIE